jgi:hypothetical protein
MPLSDANRATLRALGETLFPSTGPTDPSGADIVPDGVDALVAIMDPPVAKKLGLVLSTFELAAIVCFGRRFSRLPDEKRTRYVDGWMRSRLAPRRVVYRALRDLCAGAYYNDERVWPVLGYDGPLVGRKGAR